MITRPRPPGSAPEFNWVLVGQRTRLALVRRLRLSFEIRRRSADRRAELWVYGEDRVRRWRLPTTERGEILAAGRLAPELEELELWTDCPHAPPRWDHGTCVVDAWPFDRLVDAVGTGTVTITLRGEKAQDAFTLERTPMAVCGRAQWRIRAHAPVGKREARR